MGDLRSVVFFPKQISLVTLARLLYPFCFYCLSLYVVSFNLSTGLEGFQQKDYNLLWELCLALALVQPLNVAVIQTINIVKYLLFLVTALSNEAASLSF